MLHKPTQRKLPRKYQQAQKQQKQEVKKLSNKPVMNKAVPNNLGSRNNQRQSSVNCKVAKVQHKIQQFNKKIGNSQLQSILIQEIKGIKNELKQIKQHIGITQNQPKQSKYYEKQQKYEPQQESVHPQQQYHERIQNLRHQQRQNVLQKQNEKQIKKQQKYDQPIRMNKSYRLYEQPKQLMDVGKIQPYMKQFKIEITKNLMPLYHGYHKKSSKPVVIKYCLANKSMEHIFNLYQKLWKNIVKAKSICINKVYDLNEPLATYILVLEANKYNLHQIFAQRIATVGQVMGSLVRALQFFHECGFLYRNIHPNHVMYTYEGDIVVIDLKNVKKFVDIKGKHNVVVRDNDQAPDQFISNNRARGVKEGRKDDLQSLGYLALFILEGSLPWNINNIVQIRSKLTLKDLCGKYPGLLEYMINLSQMQTEDVPNYDKLADFFSSL